VGAVGAVHRLCARADASDACCACCPAVCVCWLCWFRYFASARRCCGNPPSGPLAGNGGKPENADTGAHVESTDAGGCLGPGNAETVSSDAKLRSRSREPPTRSAAFVKGDGSLLSLDSNLTVTKPVAACQPPSIRLLHLRASASHARP
jgi:hypothetical protein